MSLVVAAMSGGVDSTIAAAAMKGAGHEVVGITLLMWEHHAVPARRPTCGRADALDARAAAARLGIAHREIDARREFLERVVRPSREMQVRGLTPNPCILCNERIKFGLLLDEARSLGAGMLVTGHYARVVAGKLARGRDASRDQSYVLYTLIAGDRLAMVRFPNGDFTKEQVRVQARDLGLENAERAESQDLCFPVAHGEGDRPGDIVDRQGRVLGRHRGLSLYTVGQRRGLGLAGSEPRFVLALDADRNRIVVGPDDALLALGAEATGVVWDGPAPEDREVRVKLRYRHDPVPARATMEDDHLVVTFEEPQRAVTPGQALVCYEGDRVLGGGTIRVEPAVASEMGQGARRASSPQRGS